jgi:hypothetical protein
MQIPHESLSQIVGNFGMDVMEALSGTCTLWAMGRARGLRHLVCDSLVAFAVVLLHAVILMCEVGCSVWTGSAWQQSRFRSSDAMLTVRGSK